MPINAKPEYFKAEDKYHDAKTIPEKIKALEEMLSKAPSHKGAEVLRAEIKQKLSKFRAQLEKEKTQQKGKGFSLAVKKEGVAQVMVVGLVNSGKSSLVTQLTNAKPTIASYEYTTEKPEFGIMDYEGIQIQVIEIPALYPDSAYKGQGPSFFSIIRNGDLIIILLDATKNEKEQLDIIHAEFEKAQIRLNQKKPPIRVKKTGFGGVHITNQKYIKATKEEIISLLKEHGSTSAEIIFDEKTNIEELNDALNDSLAFKTAIYVKNKSDLAKGEVSAKTGEGMDKLKKKIWKNLGMIRLFTKAPGKEKEWPPLALPAKSTVEDFARHLHKDFLEKFKYARVWGKSIKHNGATVGLTHELKDGDVVEIHLK